MTKTMENANELKNSSIETLRAVAVLLVFIHHLHSISQITIPYLADIGGWLGVQIFFVISGYLIIQSALRYSTMNYVTHRISRIYPAYIFWFIAFSLIFNHLRIDSLDIRSLAIHFLFLQHFFPADYLKYNALSVSWTLTIEMTWYVVAFVIATKFAKNPLRITALFVAVACAWIFGGYKLHPFHESMTNVERYFFGINNAVAQLPFFLFGALIAVPPPPRYDKVVLLSIFVSTVLLSPAWQAHLPNPIFISGLGVAALFLILKDTEYKNPRSVKLLSDISYSFYLIHYPIIVISSKITSNKYYIFILASSATVIFAYISYKLIEQPFINMARKKSGKPSPAPVSTISASR